MQTTETKVTMTEEALAQFKEADAKWTGARAELQRYRYTHPAAKTVELALLEVKCEELARDRNSKLNRWAALKPCTDTVSVPKDIRPLCEKCGSDLIVRLSGALHCNACGFQAVGE